jgi:putative tryptophan/tyrosine transport system substrate-binding protein
MKRRELITLLAGAAAAWPLAAHAQQPAMPVIGYLSGRSPDAEGPLRTPLLAALEEAGFVVGRNVAIEYRFAEGLDERLPMLALHANTGCPRCSRSASKWTLAV